MYIIYYVYYFILCYVLYFMSLELQQSYIAQYIYESKHPSAISNRQLILLLRESCTWKFSASRLDRIYVECSTLYCLA